MPSGYNTGTKAGLSRSKTSTISIPNPDPFIDSPISVPRVLNYSNGFRTVPVMHRAFRNLEIKYANALVAVACEYRGVSASSLRVLDIGYGLGYSTQRFFELGVGTYHCLEVNIPIWEDSTNHNFAQNSGGDVAAPIGFEFFNQSFQDYTNEYSTEKFPAYDIVYYSPSDDFGNMAVFDLLRRVSKSGTILGIQGVPLFGGVNVGNFVVSSPSGVAPDANTYDSSFTVSMYNALNSIGYFSIYYQYLNCDGGGGGMIGGDLAVEEGGSACNNGTWINGRPR